MPMTQPSGSADACRLPYGSPQRCAFPLHEPPSLSQVIPQPATMAAAYKSLAQNNKSRTGVPAINKRPAAAQFLCPPPIGRTSCGVGAAGLSRPSTGCKAKGMDQITPGMRYGLAVLAVGAYSIPLLLIGWLWFRTPIRRTWVPLLFFLGLMAIIHVASELVGTDGITALIYILSGAAK